MRRRLREKESRDIDERFSDDVLYRLLADATRHYASRMRRLCLTPQEALVELADALDRLKEEPEMHHYLCQTAWDALAFELRGLNPEAGEEEVEQGTAMLLMVMVIGLNMIDSPACRTLVLGLLMELDAHVAREHLDEAREWLVTLVWRMGEERLRERMEAYWRSDGYLSDEITEALTSHAGDAGAADEAALQPGMVIYTGGGAAVMGGNFGGGVEFNAKKSKQLDYE